VAQDLFELTGGTLLSAQHFEIIRSLGTGATGEVFLARALRDGGREVALKVLENPDAFDELTLTRFRSEVQALRTLNHPNILRAFDFFDYKGCLAFTMEYVDGKDLSKLISEHKLNNDQVDEIMLQVLDAVHELHSNNIIHRDIKLENILLRNDGCIKLGDLGLMKRSDIKTLTRPGLILGTAQYMPPEYIKKGVYDERGDLYALGIVLLELLAGKRRLHAVPENKAMEHIIKSRFSISEDLLQGLTKGYRAIIAKATHLDPKRRYQNALEMRLDLIANRSSYGLLSAGQVISPDEHVKAPLLDWKSQHVKRPFWQLGLLGIVVSASMVFIWAYTPTLKPRVEIAHGEYVGLMRLSSARLTPVTFSISAQGINISGKDLGCNNDAFDIRKKSLLCGAALYRVQFEYANENQISGYITKQGSAHIVDFRAQRENAKLQNIRKG
jgi:serine/threonine protein kinase